MQSLYTLKTNETGIEALRVKGLPVITTDANARVWATWNTKFERISAKDYAEKAPEYPIVLLGVTARGASTLVATPDGLKAPHEIQASAISTLLQGKNIARPDWADGAEILALVVILTGIAALAFNLYFSIPALLLAYLHQLDIHLTLLVIHILYLIHLILFSQLLSPGRLQVLSVFTHSSSYDNKLKNNLSII